MHDPLIQFEQWFKEAMATAMIREPTAMTLATATRDGTPSARIVLLKSFDASGFVFYTNTQSRKGNELHDNPKAALLFYWMPIDKQVRIEGSVTPVSDAEADAYFASRTRLKQAGAWASSQSQPLDARETLTARVEAVEREYADRVIPRPPHWSGYRLAAQHIEFWQQGDGRLHQRDLYTRSGLGPWHHRFLYP